MTAYRTDSDRWGAVTRRDAQADGAFFYAVATTGVFCRPSCASRLPRRENVAFYDTAEAAEILGTSSNVVKVRLHRARQALRTLLDREFKVSATNGD